LTAYFTEPMGDEFRKALEEALKEVEAGEKAKSRAAIKRQKRSGRNRRNAAVKKKK